VSIVVVAAALASVTIGARSDTRPATEAGRWSVVADDATTGRRLWAKPTTAKFAVFSGMALNRGVLLGQWGNCGPHRGNADAGVTAIDARTGKVKWQTPALVGGETSLVPVPPFSDGVYVLFGYGEGPTLVGIDARTGKTRWERRDPGVGSFYGGAFVGSHLVTIRSATTAPPQPGQSVQPAFVLDALDLRTGKAEWSTPLPLRQFPRGVAVDHDRIVVGLHDESTSSATATAFDLSTGRQVWSVPGIARILAAFDGVAVGTESDEDTAIVGLDTSTGAQRWRRTDLTAREDETDNGTGSLAFAHNHDDGIDAVDIATGATRWHSNPLSDITAARPDGVLSYSISANTDSSGRHLLSLTDGHDLGKVSELPRESDQVDVPPQIGPTGVVYLGRGCPGRG